MTVKPVPFITAVKQALDKKHASVHPDTKLSKTQQKAAKRSAPPASAGKPVRKAAGRGG
jgi:hypothetical protein